MTLCSSCYIQKDEKTLMLYRNKKEKDINKNKYIGLGGRFEAGESPEECLVREIEEEAGVRLTSYRLRGIVTFVSEGASDPLYMYFYTADEYEGDIKEECDEGELCWVPTARIEELDLWEGDHLLWKWIKADEGIFSAKFVYEGDKMVEHQVNFY